MQFRTLKQITPYNQFSISCFTVSFNSCIQSPYNYIHFDNIGMHFPLQNYRYTLDLRLESKLCLHSLSRQFTHFYTVCSFKWVLWHLDTGVHSCHSWSERSVIRVKTRGLTESLFLFFFVSTFVPLSRLMRKKHLINTKNYYAIIKTT